MHAIVPSHVGSGNLESGMAAARYHRWLTPESRFFLFAANSHIGCCTNIHLATASSANRLPSVRDQFGRLCDQSRLQLL